MSGKPNRYASDPVKNRDQYMEALALRAKIDDMNLQANKTYKATGQLPPVSQMPETRTTTEILADNERLKIALIKDLEPVGDSHFAQAVIQRIQNSPLNTTGSLFTFFAQRAPEIVIQLKKLYKYKIRGDSNDVETMASFIEDMFSKTKSMTSSVSSYFTQTESKRRNILNREDYSEITRLFEDIGRRLRLKAPPTSGLGRRIQMISYALVLYVQFLTYDQMFDYTGDLVANDPDVFNIVNGRNKLDEFYDAFKRYNEILEEFPKTDTLYTLLQQLDTTIKNQNIDLTNRLLVEFQSLVNKIDEINELLPELKNLQTSLNNIRRGNNAALSGDDANVVELEEDDNVEDVNLQPPVPPPSESSPSTRPFPYDQPLFPDSPSTRPFPYDQPLFPDSPLLDLDFDEKKDKIPPNEKPNPYEPSELSIVAKRKYVEDLQNKITELETTSAEHYKKFNEIDAHFGLIIQRLNDKDYKDETEKNKLIKMSKKSEKSLMALRSSIEFTETTLTKMKKDLVQKLSELHEIDNPSGNGLRRRGRPRGCGIVKQKPYSESVKAHTSYDKGIMESPRFVKFGKYLVNNHKLNNDDMFALKHPSGGTIQEFPSVRLSKHLSNVIKKMVGGGVPSYNDLNNLSEPEKIYLHKVAKRSNIVDKFSIPAPDKDQQEKDIHEFEVLKGEIMAGNDSKELIKKFKLHLMKLSKMGALPKKEVSEVMEELIQMGY